MITIEEMKNLMIYKKPFFLPFNDKTKKNGSVIYLLTPTPESSVRLMNHKLAINRQYFESYYVEKDITYYITQEGYIVDTDELPYNVFTESVKDEYLSDPSRYVTAIQLDNFEPMNEAIINPLDFPKIEDDFYTTDTPNYKLGYPIKSRDQIKDIEDTVVDRADFYFKQVSRTWSEKKKHDKNPYRMQQAMGIDFKRKYFNRNSKDCILPKDSRIKDEFYYNRIERNGKIYTILMQDNGKKFVHFWLVFNGDLVSLDQFFPQFISESVNEETIIEEPVIDKDNLIKVKYTFEGYKLNKYYLKDNHTIIIFNEALDMIEEAESQEDMYLHNILYRERFKNNKEVFDLYDTIKEQNPWVKYTYIDLVKYKGKNLFYDLSYYNNTFLKNNTFKMDKAVDIYFDFITRFLTDERFDKFNYTRRTVFVPLWEFGETILDYKSNLNPVSMFIRMLHTNLSKLQTEWANLDFIFMTANCYFKINFSTIQEKDKPMITSIINKMMKSDFIPEDPTDEKPESTKSIVNNITDKLQDNSNVNVNVSTGDASDATKEELKDKIDKVASTSATTDDAINKLNDDERIKNLIAQVQDDDSEININKARAARINKLQDDFMKQRVHGQSVKDLIEKSSKVEPLPSTSLEIDSINEGWNNLQYINFNKVYNINEDIVAIFNFLSSRTVPVMVRNIDVQDTSTSEDYIETWNVDFEDVYGTRFKLKLDIPKIIDNNFMLLRGNDKTINGQAVLLPISKTDDDTVQIVSNYNKIFIRRYGTSVPGKMFVGSDMVIKAVSKYDKIKASMGDNTRVCAKYELPIDYIDLASTYNKIETDKVIYYFNQDEIRKLYTINEKEGLPIGYDKSSKQVKYYDGNGSFSVRLLLDLAGEHPELHDDIISSMKASNKYMYSKASVLNTEIPLIVVMAYSEGLTKALDKAHIRYEFQEKKPTLKGIEALSRGCIKFQDAYLVYEIDLASSLLMNGLKECNTEDYSVTEINGKAMYLDFLTIFGTRILADGLDNFYDLMLDPITDDVLKDYKLPIDYVELLAYANILLADNKYIDHTDLGSNRYRKNEIIAGYVYKALSESYGQYRTDLKRSRKATMTIKQSKVLDLILLDPTASDASTLNPVLESESMNSVSFKGLSGMNSDRSYGLDKRTFSKSMSNIFAMSTGFAGNVGITRQATIDMNITGKRGYIKQSNDPTKEMSITKTFGTTEALIPYAATHDDPFRLAMGFIQNSKHAMRTKVSSPQLISNGADQALPYLITNTFAFKAKSDGKVIECTDNYAVVEYKDKTKDFIDLRDNVKKNSSAGFYTSVKLSMDLKNGQSFKSGQILAYDKTSFSDGVGHTRNIAYNSGIMCMTALLNTDEGFEDSGIGSEWLSNAAASNVITQKDISLPKNTNILSIVKKGQKVEEGDILLLFQNAYDDEDVNILLKTLADDMDDVTDLGKIPIKSKYTGTIKDIKIYRTVDKSELSDSLKKLVNQVEKESDDIEKVAKKHSIDYIKGLNANYKLENTGKLKNVDEGVLIEIYIEYEDKLSIGDKMILLTANKMVIKDIFPAGKEPWAVFDPINKIDAFASIGGTSARMVTSIENTMANNRVVFYLDDVIKKKAGIKNKTLHEKLEAIR